MRYTYFLTPDEFIPKNREPKNFPHGYKSLAFVDKNSFRFVALANIDSDPEIDVWIIDKEKKLLNLYDDSENTLHIELLKSLE